MHGSSSPNSQAAGVDNRELNISLSDAGTLKLLHASNTKADFVTSLPGLTGGIKPILDFQLRSLIQDDTSVALASNDHG